MTTIIDSMVSTLKADPRFDQQVILVTGASSGIGRALALEVMIPNSAIRALMRDDKIHQIYSSMQVGQGRSGMQTMNQCLASLVTRRIVDPEIARGRSPDIEELQALVTKGPGAAGPTMGRKTIPRD